MATYPASPLPSYEYIESENHNVAVTRYPNGTEQRIKKATVSAKQIMLTYKLLSEADADVLKAFFNSMGGPLTTFNFVSFKDGASYVVRFSDSELPITMVDFDIYTASVALIEVKNETPAA